MASEHVDRVLSRLNGVKPRSQNSWMAKCPCRDDDSTPSLAVSEGEDGRALVHCFTGRCNYEQICSAMGLEPKDLMPGDTSFSGHGSERSFSAPKPQVTKVQAPAKKKKTKFVKSYDYFSEDGELLFQKVRLIDEDGKKSFIQRKSDGQGGYVYSLGDTPKVLYNLPQVMAAKESGEEIWLVEGEKDADTLTDLNLVATTAPLGAGKWLDIHTEALRGAQVEIIVDNDEAGIQHGAYVDRILNEAGIPSRMWICPREKDITDFLGSGGEFSDLMPFTQEQASDSPHPTDNFEEEEEVDVESIPEEKTPTENAVEKLQELVERDDLNSSQVVAKASMILAALTSGKTISDPGRLVQWNDFIEEEDDASYKWIIPGFLEEQERVIVVAAEGVGKTMLARQIAICSSAGINPFTYQEMPPVRTLTVDLENPERIIRRMSRGIVTRAMSMSAHKSKVARIHGELLSKPAGIDLLKPQDRLYLEERIEQVKPQLIVMGPLYKSFVDPGGRTSEAVAVEIAKYLDNLRTVYKCALWLEHHAPLGTTMSTRELRPFGSAVWSRWPEFGLALQPDPAATAPYVYTIKHFRGARDQRYWPQKMERAKTFPFKFSEFTNVDQGYIGVPAPVDQRYD